MGSSASLSREASSEDESADEVGPLRSLAHNGLQWMNADEVRAITVPFSKVGEQLPAVMQTYGVAVVSDVIVGKDLGDLLSAWQADLLSVIPQEQMSGAPDSVQETFHRFKGEGPTAFPLASSKKFTFGSGFVVDRCLSHGSFAWMVRTHANVHKVFQALHGNVPLVSSIDVPFFTPEDVGHGPKPPYDTAHVDQNMHDIRGDLASVKEYQGVLYAWPCRQEDESTATVVWPRSYQEGNARCPYAQFMDDMHAKRLGKSGTHYTQLVGMAKETKRAALKKQFEREARRIPVPAGGLLLWNSKTVHTGAQRGPRLAQAVCLEPEQRRSAHERLAKLRMAALGLPSMHWASHGIQHDCIRLRKGYLTEGQEVIAKAGNSHSEMVLPQISAIHPWCTKQDAREKLLRCADLDGLIMNVQADEELEEFAELLESCIVDEAKAVL